MNQALFRFASSVVALTVSGFVGLAQAPCTFTVDEGQSIQTAIAAAPAGAVICLQAGAWEENIRIDKNLTLRGSGAAETSISGLEANDAVIYIDSNEEIEVNIDAITIAEGKGSWGAGVFVGGRARLVLADCTVRDNAAEGVAVWELTQASISDCTISGNGDEGITVFDEAQVTVERTTIDRNGLDGIYVADFSRLILTGSTVADNGWDGIYLEDSAQATLVDCTVWGHDAGVGLLGLTQVVIERCTFTDNNLGVVLGGEPAQATITDSTFSGNEFGVAIGASSTGTVQGCVVTGNGYGIVAGNEAHVTLLENRITESAEYGVALFVPECDDDGEEFTGYIAGRGNVIPEPGAPGGNAQVAVCPADLGFLTTAHGGELDRR